VRNGGSLTSLVVKISVTHRRENVISLPTAASDGGQDEQMKNAKCSCRQRDRVAPGVCVLGLVVAQAANYKPLRRSASVALAASLCATRCSAKIVRKLSDLERSERHGRQSDPGRKRRQERTSHTTPSQAARACMKKLPPGGQSNFETPRAQTAQTAAHSTACVILVIARFEGEDSSRGISGQRRALGPAQAPPDGRLLAASACPPPPPSGPRSSRP